MPSFAANLTLLFREYDFLDRFAAAARAGFQGVECLFPYDWPAPELALRLADTGLRQVLFNAPAGDWQAGERGIACLPWRRDEFRRGIEQAMRYAEALECPRIHCLAGIPPAHLEKERALATLEDNLAWAVERLAGERRYLLVEPINSRVDMPGYLLDDVAMTRDLVQRLNRPNLRLQFDLYHAGVMEGNPEPWLRALLPIIDHVQCADVPGRHEPGSGDLPLASCFRLLDARGYTGWVGAEYHPRGKTEEGLDWLKRYSLSS